MTKFYKVSKKEFEKGYKKIPAEFAKVPAEEAYKALTLPKRATKGSAGYDFVSPVDFFLCPGETILLPTGIRCEMKENQVLLLFPRSGMGFKYRLQLNNTVGVIDSDYFYSDNEGHIMAKITNDSNEGKLLKVKTAVLVRQTKTDSFQKKAKRKSKKNLSSFFIFFRLCHLFSISFSSFFH